MVLDIVKFGHPALRQKGSHIEQITPEITRLISDMFATMKEANGIGLAAPQVAQPLQLAVVDVQEVTDRPSTLEIDGQPADVNSLMPLVLINPKILPFDDMVSGPEGCLSFPEIYEDISRPERVEVEALDAKGQPLKFKAGGLLSRVIQHETDHLNGILFIDRMSITQKQELKEELDQLRSETRAALGSG